MKPRKITKGNRVFLVASEEQLKKYLAKGWKEEKKSKDFEIPDIPELPEIPEV